MWSHLILLPFSAYVTFLSYFPRDLNFLECTFYFYIDMLKVIPSSVSHARGIYLLDRLLLVATKLIDNCEGDRCPAVVDLHTVVLVALYRTGIESVVEDVAAIETHAPSSIMRRPLQFGIHSEDRTYVVNSLYCL